MGSTVQSSRRSPLGLLSYAPQSKYEPSTGHDKMSIRLNDAPMDYDYESPARLRHSSWLQSAESSKAELSRLNMDDAMHTDTSMQMAGIPLSPTIEGPDIEMETSMQAANGDVEEERQTAAREEAAMAVAATSRPESSSGALVRTAKARQHTNGQARTFSLSSLLGRKTSARKATRKRQYGQSNGNDDDYDWVDEDGRDEGDSRRGLAPARTQKSSLRRRMGNTMNNYYFLGDSGKAVRKGREAHYAHVPQHALRWTDPEWCLGMAQFIFNAVLLLGVAYVLFSVLRTLQRDVSDKVREYELEFLAEIESCSQSYHLNKCGTQHAVPALAAACAQWQRCSAKDPAIVGRSRVAAETVAEIVNGFVDVVSWKSMAFTLLLVIIVVGATNSTLSFFRLRSRHDKDRTPSLDRSRSARAPAGDYDTRDACTHEQPAIHHSPYNFRSRGQRSSPTWHR